MVGPSDLGDESAARLERERAVGVGQERTGLDAVQVEVVERVTAAEDLCRAIERGFAEPGPTLIEAVL